MGAAILKMYSKTDKDKLAPSDYKSVLDIPCKDLIGDNKEAIGAKCQGKKAILIVNVVTKWGLTNSNYK